MSQKDLFKTKQALMPRYYVGSSPPNENTGVKKHSEAFHETVRARGDTEM